MGKGKGGTCQAGCVLKPFTYGQHIVAQLFGHPIKGDIRLFSTIAMTLQSKFRGYNVFHVYINIV